jgi:hypothetical protein
MDDGHEYQLMEMIINQRRKRWDGPGERDEQDRRDGWDVYSRVYRQAIMHNRNEKVPNVQVVTH